jgi:hypothetical protein
MDFVEETAAVRLEWPMYSAGRSARISARWEALAAFAFGVVTDREVAL